MMARGKLSSEDKTCIQNLCVRGLEVEAIRASYPDKQWSVGTLQKPLSCRTEQVLQSLISFS